MPAGFPHSEISGSKVACTSPKLIAACHVLLRLHAPRHPPCALSSLTIKFAQDKKIRKELSLLEHELMQLTCASFPNIDFLGKNFLITYSVVKEHKQKQNAFLLFVPAYLPWRSAWDAKTSTIRGPNRSSLRTLEANCR